MKLRILKTDFKYQTFSGILSDFSKKQKNRSAEIKDTAQSGST